MPKKPTTTDDLARLISAGFDGVEKRFTKLEEKMATKAALEALEEKVATKEDVAAMKDAVLESVAFFMAQYVPRFVDLTKIEQRLERLEKQTGIRK